MIKFIIPLTFLISIYAFADEAECDPPIPSLIQNVGIKNCIDDNLLKEELKFRKKNKNKSNTNLEAPVCQRCKKDFFDKYTEHPTKSLLSPQLNLSQKAYFEAMYNELEKSMTTTILDVAALRNSLSANTNFMASTKSCNINEFEKSLDQCSAGALIKAKGLGSRLANEIAILIDNNPKSLGKGVLSRQGNNECSIPDKEISQIKINLLEKSINPEDVKVLLSLKFKNPQDFRDQLRNSNIKNKYFFSLISSHPILSILLKNPEQFNAFFEGLQGIPEKDLTKAIQLKLYRSDINYGEMLDKDIAARCEQTFKAFEEKICGEDFKKADINLGGFENSNKLFYGKYTNASTPLAGKDSEIEDNLVLFNFCDDSGKQKSLNLKEDLQLISKNQNQEYENFPLKKFADDKYEKDFLAPQTSICSYIKPTQKDCTDDSFSCKLYQEYKQLHDKNSSEFRLASAPNKSVNELLRSFVGDPKKLDPETKKVLQDQGVIPQDNGKFIATPDIPERSPSYFDKVAQDLGKSAPQKSATTQTQAARVQSPDQGTSAANSNQADAGSYSPSPSTSTDSTKSTDDYDKQMSDINNEIARRLAEQKGSSSSSKKSQSEVREAVKKVYNDQGKSLDPAQEDSVVNNFMNQGATTAQVAPTQANTQGPSNNYQAKLTPGKSPDQVKREAQELAALSGMQGAQAANRSPASAKADPEDTFMSKVTVNASEEKVQLRLEDILNDKIRKSDADGQMLKALVQNKRDFILEINNLSFKIIFDKASNNFKVTSNSGDSAQSEKIRPQLEKFLKNIY